MKYFAVPVFFAATLSGCAVVPYDGAYATYPAQPVYAQAYPAVPAYAAPAPVYGPPVYVGPPVSFRFGLNYWSGTHRSYRPRFRGHWR